MKTIVVTGGREWDNPVVVEGALTVHGSKGDTLIHGNCRGLDRQAGAIAKNLGFIVDSMPAEWGRYGKGAGPIRNRQMLDRQPDLVLSFHPNLEQSRGTKDCVEEAIRRGIPVMHHDGRNAYWLNGPNVADVTF